MNPIVTLLIYAGIPLVVVVVVAALVLGGNRTHLQRYRPGRPFSFAPVWFLAAPDDLAGPHPGAGDRPQVEAARRSEQHSVAGLPVPVAGTPVTPGAAKGGARGTW